MHDVACARAVVRSKDAQKQLARTSLKSCGERNTELRAITTPSYKQPHKLSELRNTQLNLLTVTCLAISK